MKDENQFKDELQKLMHERNEKAKQNIKHAKDIQGQETQILDLSDAGQKILKFPSGPEVDLKMQIDNWRESNNQADKLSSGFITLELSAATTGGLTFVMTQFLESDYSSLSQTQQDAAKTVQNNLRLVINRPQHKGDVINLLHRFDLGKTITGKKSALQQFETAWAAFDHPVTTDTPTNTSLIPVREAIETAIAQLLMRRPEQEPTKNQEEKIISIGKQLAHDGMSETSIKNWASQWRNLQNKLSGSKDNDLSREDWQKLLLEATLFLKELLLGLDVSKL